MLPRQLSAGQRKYLLLAHLLFASLWGGGATSMVLIVCLFHPQTAHELLVYSSILFYIDFLIVGPGAGGCFITGFLYARCTPWGFFKYNWIVAKWCANVGFILFGLLWFVPSLESAVTAARALPMEFPLAPESIGTNIWHLVQNLGTALLFAGVLALSVFKPCGKTPWAAKASRPHMTAGAPEMIDRE